MRLQRKPLKWAVTENGCFEPTSHKSHDGKGYPAFYWTIEGKQKIVRIYRLLFEERFGPVPQGLVIRHTCDNRRCINTDHMILGTRADNMHDRHSRTIGTKGEANGRSIITEEDVRFILRSTQKTKKLARKFKVSRDAIYAIRTGRRWKHLHAEAVC